MALLALQPAAAEAKLNSVPRTYTSSSGSVTATLTATENPGGPPSFQDLHLQIARSGVTVLSQAVQSVSCAQCGLLVVKGAPPPVQVVDLEGKGEPNVVLQLYSGGAHCCTVVQVFSYQTGAYHSIERNFFEAPSQVADLAGNGAFEFVSADNRFAYEFAPYAYSALPIRIYHLDEGAFSVETPAFPAAIEKDAAKWLRLFRRERAHALGNGPIAAWAADEENLGHDALVRRTLAREARHGRLRSSGHYGPSGRAFAKALLRFLARTGYR